MAEYMALTPPACDMEAEEPTEAELIARARQDRQVFGQLYTLYVQRVFGYLYSRIGSVAEAEDATAQTFLAALEMFGRYRHDGHFAAWLFGIARHKAADFFRHQRNQTPLEDAYHVASDGEADVLQRVIQTERVAALKARISCLPEAERELLHLRYVAELSFRDIARLLGRSEAAVKKSLYRLQDRLADQLEGCRER